MPNLYNFELQQSSRALVPISPIGDSGSQLKVIKLACPNVTLLKMLAEHRTGSLTFRDNHDPSVSWRVYLDQGKIVFADSGCGHETRLKYLLRALLPGIVLESSKQPSESIYSALCEIWVVNDLPPNKLQQVLAYSTQEALVQVFAMRKCEIVYDPSCYFPPVIKSSSFSALIDPVEPWISQWRGIRNDISSPFQRLFIRDLDLFINLVTYTRSRYPHLHQLNLDVGKNYTLYELATRMRMKVRDLAVALHPMIRAGAVGVRVYQRQEVSMKPLVASLSQKRLDQQLTQRSLERSGFQVLKLQNPLHCIEQLKESKPSIALLDSSINNVNVFDICRKIRQVTMLKELPIILLMREEHLWGDRRGRWAGANACLQNPIRPQDLVRCVKQWHQKTG